MPQSVIKQRSKLKGKVRVEKKGKVRVEKKVEGKELGKDCESPFMFLSEDRRFPT